MRLLNVHSGAIKLIMADKDIPPYAVLSHRWGSDDDEVSYEDWQTPPESFTTVSSKPGYRKIYYCRKQAIADGIDWIWVDTCCIDNKSSAELSEAINSMFRWYQNAKVCYAYLSDVPTSNNHFQAAEGCQSRWFSRGWTLQELIAPKDVIFYSSSWERIGAKSDPNLRDLLSHITAVEPKYLCGADLDEVSVAKRMSWAAKRTTSRTEDMAYCLMGIFDINMPLLYGEGTKAFRRLQEEILKSNPYDLSLFAWGKIVPSPSFQLDDREYLDGEKPIPWSAEAASISPQSLLAESPSDFEESAYFAPSLESRYFYFHTKESAAAFPTIIGKGIRLELGQIEGEHVAAYHLAKPRIVQPVPLVFALLLCDYKDSGGASVAIPLLQWGSRLHGRTREIIVLDKAVRASVADQTKRSIHIEPAKPLGIEHGDLLIRRFGRAFQLGSTTKPSTGVFSLSARGLVKTIKGKKGRLLNYNFRLPGDNNSGLGFSIILSRGPGSDNPASIGRLKVAILPTYLLNDRCRPPDACNPYEAHGLKWYCTHMAVREGSSHHYNSCTVKLPEDTWELDMAPFPSIKVRVARMPIEDGSKELFDLVDFIILRRSRQTEPQSPRESQQSLGSRRERSHTFEL
ncbi:heterokaryon incompatibility protein-domain-containing protein [Lasiosphaeris hirsuta]|uniref:Heterokaryon incompatibility protein-domain-containing protein n=1 Tax=Lasiosphaeris hirsuta TaxID=260670 RepID=A0AA40BAW4_9PEZI|nr:heterokaryon incompatibility protein-domain-containing protein [Lasiosphaeris hirsuta]